MPVANSYSSPSVAGGNREDLRDILTILEPESTPVTSMIKKGPSPKATFVEWLSDSLRKPRTTGLPEGQDVTMFSNKAANRARFGNYIHILRDSYAVTDVEEKVDVAASTDLFAEAKAKTIREMKRDIEAIVCGNQEMQQGTGDVGWVTRGLGKWIQHTAQAVNPVPEAFRPPAAQCVTTGSGTTEAQFNDIIQSLFTVYGEAKTLSCVAGVDIIDMVDNYTRMDAGTDKTSRYTVTEYAESKKITLSVRVFDSSFGTVKMIPDQFLAVDANGEGSPTTAYFLNPELLALEFLDPLHSVDLKDEGGGPRGYAKAMFLLRVNNPRGLAKITPS